MTPRPDLFTRSEAATYLRCKESWLRHHLHLMPRIKIGRAVLYRKADLDAYLDSLVLENTCATTSSNAARSTTPACGLPSAGNGSGAPPASEPAMRLRDELRQLQPNSPSPKLRLVAENE